MTRSVFSMTDPPSNAHRQNAAQHDWRRRTWRIWGIVALIWFVGATAFYGFGGSSAHQFSTMSAPLLSGNACNSVLGIAGQQSCQGVANMSRDRRTLQRTRASQHAIMAGSIILGPPLLSLVGLLGFMHYTRPRTVIPKREPADPAPHHGPSRRTAL